LARSRRSNCEVEDIVERHSHAIVIGRVRDIKLSERSAVLAYWHGRDVAIDQDEDIALLAKASFPLSRLRRRG
jgi:flavin reductase (DIM6/NTAB) family NADH-FMN oxidoreductase RutF